jgi:hypothetical protein
MERTRLSICSGFNAELSATVSGRFRYPARLTPSAHSRQTNASISENREQIHRATVRAFLAGHIQRGFHLVECGSNISHRHSSQDRGTFAAHDIDLIASRNWKQATAAFGIAEISVREDRPFSGFHQDYSPAIGPVVKKSQRAMSGESGQLESTVATEKRAVPPLMPELRELCRPRFQG